jgi:hypothetical protein
LLGARQRPLENLVDTGFCFVRSEEAEGLQKIPTPNFPVDIEYLEKLTALADRVVTCKYTENKNGMSIPKILKLAGKILTHKVTNIKMGECAYIQTTSEDTSVTEKIDFLAS